jgi:hypothetical protein
MLLRRDQIWIFEPARVSVFNRDGDYLRTLLPRLQLAAPIRVGNETLCRRGAGPHAVAAVDDSLHVLTDLGRCCVSEMGLARSRACGFLQILPHPDHRCLLIDPLEGTLRTLDEDGDITTTRSLINRNGRVDQSADGRVAEFHMVLARGFVDDEANLWVLREQPEDGSLQMIEVRDRDFTPIAEFELPEGVTGYLLAGASGGELVLLDYAGSAIHLLARPKFSGA